MSYPTYSIENDLAGEVDPQQLADELRALGGVDLDGLEVEGDQLTIVCIDEPDAAGIAAIDAVIAAHDALPGYKRRRCLVIDARTQELIAQGFEFPPSSGNRFSLSLAGQSKINGANQAREDPAFVYPVEWNMVDDSGTISITDAAMLHNFFLSALVTYRAVLDAGTALKNQIRVATSVAEVDAVIDNR
jgi:hypothetical protein